jgi:hypothetical protein
LAPLSLSKAFKLIIHSHREIIFSPKYLEEPIIRFTGLICWPWTIFD